MTIMKRLLLPFLLLGLALLPSGISAAKQGQASDVGVSVPTHGKHHPHHKHKHHHPDDNEAEQEAKDNDEQESEQTNIAGEEGLIDDVIPIAANIPVIPIQNINVIAIQLINTVVDVIPINVCAVIPAVTGEDVDESECELPGGDEQEQSQLRNMEANAGNDSYEQSNESDQEQESEQEQEQGQVNVGHSAPAETGSSQTLVPTG